MTYWPLRAIVEQAAAIARSTSSGHRSDVPGLGRAPGGGRRRAAAGHRRRGHRLGVPAHWSRASRAAGPLVLVLDDAHLAEPALLRPARRRGRAAARRARADRLGGAPRRARRAPSRLGGAGRPGERPRARSALTLGHGDADRGDRRRAPAAGGANCGSPRPPAGIPSSSSSSSPTSTSEASGGRASTCAARAARRAPRPAGGDRAVRADARCGGGRGVRDEGGPCARRRHGSSRARAGVRAPRRARAAPPRRRWDDPIPARRSCARSPTPPSPRLHARGCTSSTPPGWSATAPSSRRPTRASALHLEAACRYAQRDRRRDPRATRDGGGPATRRGGARGARTRATSPARSASSIGPVALFGPEQQEGAELMPTLVAALIEAGEFSRAERLAQRAVAASASLRLPGVGAIGGGARARRLYRHPESFAYPPRRPSSGMRRARCATTSACARAEFLMADIAWLTGDTVGGVRPRGAHARRTRGARRAGRTSRQRWSS